MEKIENRRSYTYSKKKKKARKMFFNIHPSLMKRNTACKFYTMKGNLKRILSLCLKFTFYPLNYQLLWEIM